MRRALLFFTGAMVAAALIQAAPALGVTLPSISPPTISGTPDPGSTLTCVPPAEPAGTVLSYSWQTSGASPTTLGSGHQLPITTADAGDSITCTLTAVLGVTSLSTTSAPVTVPGPPVDISPPTITQSGDTLTCNPGTWTGSPSSFSYTWLEGAPPTANGTMGQNYTLAYADLGQELICTVQATDADGTSALAVLSGVYVPTSLAGSSGGAGGSGAGGGSGGGGGSSGGGGGSSQSGGASTKVPAPLITAFRLSTRRLVLHVGNGRVTSAGMTLRYAVNRLASGLIGIERRTAGGKYKTVALLGFRNVRAGAHGLRLKPSLARKLQVGGYLAVIAAADTGGWSSPHYLYFTVVRQVARPPKHAHGKS